MINHQMRDVPDGIRGVSQDPVPRRRGSFFMFFCAVLLMTLGCQVATQVFAWRVGYHVGRGFPLYRGPIPYYYQPYSIGVWYWKYEVAPEAARTQARHAAQSSAGTSPSGRPVVPPPRFTKAEESALDWDFGISLFAGAVVFLLVGWPFQRFGRRMVPGILGGDTFANDREIRKWGYTRAKRGLVLGSRVMRDRFFPRRELIYDAGEAHAQVCMGTGQGKNAAIITTSLALDSMADSSIFLIDPPGETWDQVAGARRGEMGNYCVRIAFGRDRAKHPDLGQLNYYDSVPRGNKRDFMVVHLLSSKHIDRDGNGVKGKNAFFYLAAMQVADLLGLVHVYGEDEGFVATGEAILDCLSRRYESFVEFLNFAENMNYSCSGKYSWIDPMTGERTTKHPVALRLIGLCRQIRDDELGSVLQTFNNGFSMYANQIVAENTRASSFALDRVMDYDRPLFVCMEMDVADEPIIKPLLVLAGELFLAFNQSNDFLAKGPDGAMVCTHKRDAYFMVNEAYSVGKIDAHERGVTTSRKFRIRHVMFYQSVLQPEQIYGKGSSLDEMMTTKLFSAAGSPAAQEIIASYSGTHTIAYDTDSIDRMGQVSYSGHVNSAPVIRKSDARRIPYEQIINVPMPTKRVPADKVMVLEKFEWFGTLIPEINRLLKRRVMIPAPPLSDRLDIRPIVQTLDPALEEAFEESFRDVLREPVRV